MDEAISDLPRSLGDGLVLRWATPADTEAIAEFNYRLHNDAPDGQPEIWLKDWTRDLMSGRHPTTGPADFTVVVDESQGGKIVSTACLISQTWTYDGLPFGCGRPELIATDEAYRRRGLVRQQMAALHAKSAARGELVQAITGIPWYYRQFGYDMALALGGWRALLISDVKPPTEGQDKEAFRLRQATAVDLPFLQTMYDQQSHRSLIACQRDEAIWQYELAHRDRPIPVRRDLHIIETAVGRPVAAVHMIALPNRYVILEMELSERSGYSWRAICLYLARELKRRLESAPDTRPDSAPTRRLHFGLGVEHPAYEALGSQLGPPARFYAWYLRVPDLAAFLRHIGPVLEDRLATSLMAGYDGLLRLSFYTHHLALRFTSGRLEAVEPYEPRDIFDADAFFPDTSFLQLLFGRGSLEMVQAYWTDCSTSNDEATLLVKALFPQRPSHVIPVC